MTDRRRNQGHPQSNADVTMIDSGHPHRGVGHLHHIEDLLCHADLIHHVGDLQLHLDVKETAGAPKETSPLGIRATDQPRDKVTLELGDIAAMKAEKEGGLTSPPTAIEDKLKKNS